MPAVALALSVGHFLHPIVPYSFQMRLRLFVLLSAVAATGRAFRDAIPTEHWAILDNAQHDLEQFVEYTIATVRRSAQELAPAGAVYVGGVTP